MSIAFTSSRVHVESWRLLIGIAFFLLPSAAGAADSLWNLPVNGTFNVAADWFGGVPGLFDRARFEITSSDSPTRQRTYSVNFTNSPINDQLIVEDDNVTFDLVGQTYTLWNDFVGVALGTVPNRSGNLTVTGGTVHLDSGADLEIAPVAGARGVLTVGAGGFVLGAPDVLVGLSGNGTLNVDSGGNVTAALTRVGGNIDSKGIANITGGGLVTTTLRVGVVGSAELNIAAGGKVESNSGSIGTIAGGTATATVTGDGSRWISSGPLDVAGETVVGKSGTLLVSNGGQMEASTCTIGGSFDGTGTVTIDGVASSLVTEELYVGGFFGAGTGTLNVLSGARVDSTFGRITSESGTAMATVSGAGSNWELSQLLVGDFGRGELMITGGGVVSTLNPIIAAQEFSKGTATVAGADSRWTATGFFGIGGDGRTRIPGGTGTLRIQPGGIVTGPLEIVVFDGGHLTLEGGTLSTFNFGFANGATAASNFSWTSGTLVVANFFGNLVNQAGVIAPSSSTGTAISGDYSQLTSATLQIEIGGVATTAFDRVNVAGGITLLGGELEVSLINGFVPSPTDAFTVLSTQIGSFTGSFDNVASGQRLTTSDGLGSFLVSYGPGSPQVVLSAFLPALGGDFDSDGDVDGADFLVWQRGGSPNANSATDLAAWRGNFGFSGLVVTGTAVPELDSALMAWALIILRSLCQRIGIHTERIAANRS